MNVLMKFRTEIEQEKSSPLSHANRILMMGSCFTTNIGEQLSIDGFNVAVNPTGVLYNPASIAGMINRAAKDMDYTEKDMVRDDNGVFHLLDFPNAMQGCDAEQLLNRGNNLLKQLQNHLNEADTLIITFGTAWVFDLNSTGLTVGNCHKLPSSAFTRRRMTIEEIVELWKPLLKDRRVIFTVSPIRHTADGLHGNSISKAVLQLAVDALVNEGAEYFPAYEIMMDDLRDYRFYAPDMKHPSQVAVEYIYEQFKNRFFTPETVRIASEARKNYKFSQHRQLL